LDACEKVFFTSIQVEEGSTPSQYEYKPVAVEMKNCERFFQTSYCRLGGNKVSIGATSQTDGSILQVQIATGAGSIPSGVRFTTEMFKAPSVTLYDTNNGTSGRVWAHNAGTSITGVATFTTPKGFVPTVGTAITADSFLSYHFSAECEP
jgi:hypothetical protein